MEQMLNADSSYPFDRIEIKTPKAIQGGTYSAKLTLDDTVIIIQTPKCHTKNGIHTTIKQIYCDLLMNKNHEEFITWLRKLQEKVRELVLANADNWFHEPVTLDEIDHNWNNSIRIYKQTNYLVRTFVHKLKNINKPSLQIFDSEEVELDLEDVTADKQVICILEIIGLKFSSQSFQLEICLRQMMVINEKPLYDKCLIKLNNNKMTKTVTNLNNDNNKEELALENKDEPVSENKEESASENKEEPPSEKKEEDIESTDNTEKITVETINNIDNADNQTCSGQELVQDCNDDAIDSFQNTNNISNIVEGAGDGEEDINNDKEVDFEKAIDLCNNNISEKTDISKASLENININDKKLTEKSPEHNKYLEGNNLEEIDLEIENSEPIVLKNPSEVYLDIYRTARQKAKMAKNAAIKAYLEAKRIKELYMLDVADSSEEEEETTDEESELFSEN